jgi:hypothetical protein
MSGFAIKVIVGVLADQRVQEFIIKLMKILLGDVIADKLKPMFSFMLGSAVKQFGEMIPGVEQVKAAVDFAGNIQNDMDRMAESLPNTGNPSVDKFIDDFWGKDNK